MGVRSEATRAFGRNPFSPGRVVAALSARAINGVVEEDRNLRKRLDISINNLPPTPDFSSAVLPRSFAAQPHTSLDRRRVVRGNTVADRLRKLAHPI